MQKIYNTLIGKYYWLIVFVVFIISRVSTWLFPFDSDHWIFYYIGRRWVQGGTLYIDMWDHKSPLIFAYNGLLHILFGGNIVLHRIFFTLIAGLAIWLFYITSVRLYKLIKLGNAITAAKFSTLLFAFIANLSQFTNSGNNNENLGLVFVLGTLFFYLKYRESTSKNANWLLLSGLFAGFVFMLKANFIILLLPLLVDLVVTRYKNAYRLIAGLVYAIFGILLQLLFWAVYFTHVGTFKQFMIATFSFNSKYIGALGWDIHAPGIMVFLGILILLLLFFAPAIISSMADFWRSKNDLMFFVMALGISGLLLIVAAGTFYSHYFLIAIPYFCLVFGAKLGNLRKFRPKILFGSLTIIAVIMLLISFKQLYNSFYGSVAQDARNQAVVAGYIKDNTDKDDTFFAYTYGATFYRLADRNSGTRFISASHPLIDYKYSFGYDFNRTFIFDMENSEAKYIVMSSDPSDIYRVQNPVLMRYFSNNYHLEKQLAGYDILRSNE